MKNETQNILGRVKKLLALAHDGGATEAEAAVSCSKGAGAVAGWAERSKRYSGWPLLVCTSPRRSPGHCLVLQDGRIYG